MPIRLIDVFLPQEHVHLVEGALEGRDIIGFWTETPSDGRVHAQVLVATQRAEGVLDELQQRLVGIKDFRIVILPVVASIPRLKEGDTADPDAAAPEKERKKAALRVSREELYAQISNTVKLTPVYAVLVILSAVVAAIGLNRDSPAVVIAAMVIAPMLGPNMALSLAATLADWSLAARSLKTLAVGTAVALFFSVLAGRLAGVNLAAVEFASRTQASLGDVALALSAGAAGALAFTTSAATWLVGVMVAVALLPPLVTGGMLLGAGELGGALGAMLLFVTNVICVNLAAIGTFAAQGIRPRTWWEANKARRATRMALAIWGALLALLVILILLWQRFGVR
jgi:uncharacterized hydrophobic protein (TIGR00341 family)